MKNKLLIIGASGHGKVVADIAIKMNKWKKINFLDDNESIKMCMGIEVIGKSADAFTYIDEADIFIAIGNNATRERFYETLAPAGASIPTLIHPNAVIGPEVELGAGTVVMAGAVINSSTKMGKACLVNTGVIIEHDNMIEDFVHISPGALLSGYCKVGRSSWLGIRSVVICHINITSDCKINDGAAVIRDITEPGTYVGNPVRKINNG